jgi:hypothetical protein
MANLQVFGAWSGQPTASEFFTIAFSHLSVDGQSDLPACDMNLSPASQVSGQNGDLIGPETGARGASGGALCLTQKIDGIVVTSDRTGEAEVAEGRESPGINRHRAENPGDQFAAGEIGPLRPNAHAGHDADNEAEDSAAWGRRLSEVAPVRAVRRGRPAVIDDVAKGRVLGLMAFGLSFRQAAAQLRVHHQTLLNAMKRDEPFAQQVAEARLDAVSQPLVTVVQAARTNWRAAAWLAKFLSDRQTRIYETTPEEDELKRMRS